MPTIPLFLLHVPYECGYCGHADNGKRHRIPEYPHQESAMGHAVMTHTQNQINYMALPADSQNLFDRYMEQADNAGTNHDYRTAMTCAALAASIPLPDGGEIALCACPNCWHCGRIFNANDRDAHPFGESTGYNLGRIQCPTCADAHRANDEQ